MKSILRKTDSFKYIWLYGAGIVANIVLEYIHDDRIIPINGVVITQKDPSITTIRNIPVFSLDEINTPTDQTIFIVAVSEKSQQEIQNTLENKGYYNYLLWNKDSKRQIWRLADYYFEDRRKNYNKVCFVLSGYKEFLWNNVFTRLSRFVPNDVEICILSSGLYHPILAEIARENDWSYLSTEINSVTLIQNIAYEIYDSAQYIFKMDEDILLTESCFEKLIETYERANKEDRYQIGFVGPLIPLNGYGYYRILDKFHLVSEYEEELGRALIGGNIHRNIEKNPEAALFMWGFKSKIPQIDKLNEMMPKEKHSYCNVRFSIGFILFTRDFWTELGGFDVTGEPDMGYDEIQMDNFCMTESYAIVVAENTVVGHFSFGKQTQVMKEYFEKNPKWFEI